MSQKLLLVAAAIGMSCAFLEVALRVSGHSPDFLFQLDPRVSATFIPGKEANYRFAEGQQYVRINSYGFRDAERQLMKPPDVRRIAVLGDSFVAALEVPQSQRVTDRIEAQLNRETGGATRWEVLNFGVPGYGTGQQLEVLRQIATPFQPDLVLLFFCSGNDWYDNSLELDPEPNRLHFTVDDQGRLTQLPYTISDNTVKRWLRHHSALYLYVRTQLMRLQAVHRSLVAAGIMQNAVSAGELARSGETLKGRQHLRKVPPEIERAWQLSEALIREVARFTAEHGMQFGIVIVPTRIELEAARGAAVDSGDTDVMLAIQRIKQIAERNRIPYVSLIESFEASPLASTEIYYERDGHWAAAGHDLVSKATMEWVRTSFPGLGLTHIAEAARVDR